MTLPTNLLALRSLLTKHSHHEILEALNRLEHAPTPHGKPIGDVVALDEEDPDPNDPGFVLTCALCNNDDWWQRHYGSLWEFFKWLSCGPLGNGCLHEPEAP